MFNKYLTAFRTEWHSEVKWLAHGHITVLSYSKDIISKRTLALWGLNIRNSLGRLYLSSNGTAKDLLHFVLAHLGGFYSQINSTRLLLNTNDIL